jgi:oligopeptide transport system ATP-binding protein
MGMRFTLLENNASSEILLDVRALDISFHTPAGELHAVNGISYTVREGEVMGLVGESGSGKTVGAYSILGLLKAPAEINNGNVFFLGRDILTLSKKEAAMFRGKEISMIFQNPMTSLDPVFTIGYQMIETIRAHDKSVSKADARSVSIDMLREVSIRDPEQLMRQYPYALSGGMRQRVMIAMALLCKPKLLIADEPTTALDVTIQATIIQILKKLQKQHNMAMLYITHNFGIVAEICDRVSVMCGGYILEQGSTDDIFYSAAHPYTQLLLRMVPRMDTPTSDPLVCIEGPAADPVELPEGCVFQTRCPSCMDICRNKVPPNSVLAPGHTACCWLLGEQTAEETGRIRA